MTWPVLVLWLLIFYGAFSRGMFMLYLFFAAGTFGGMSLLPAGAFGNVPVATVCAGVLIAKTFLHKQRFQGLLTLALDIRKLGILTVFSLYMVATALIYPRLFAGQVELYPLNAGDNLSLLRPSSTNITQPIYMLTAIGMTFVFAYCGQSPAFRTQFLRASLFGAIMLLGSGVVDVILGNAGHEDLLAPFHNAAYHQLNDVAVAGQKRVVGFMPEASVFGAVCCSHLGFLVFNRQLYQGWVRNWLIPAMALSLLYLIYASTSSGAYIGVAMFALTLSVRFVIEMAFAVNFTPAHIRKIAFVGGLLLAASIVAAFLPAAFYAHMRLILDEVLFQKTNSFSYAERTSWTKAGLAAFFATHGIGVGVGSARTSNWFVNFAASTGVVGIFLFGIFVAGQLMPSKKYPDAIARRFANGLKLALIPGFIVNCLSGTTPDPGVEMMLSFGMLYALKQKPRPIPGYPAPQPAFHLSPPPALLTPPSTRGA